MKDKRLAVIFEKKNNYAQFKCITFVKFDCNNQQFKIQTGEYAGLGNSDFDILNGDSAFVYGSGSSLFLNRNVLYKNDMIYIFDKTLIDKRVDYTKKTEYGVFYDIFKHVASIKLKMESVDKVTAHYVENSNISYKIFYEMLDEQDKSEIIRNLTFFPTSSVVKTSHLKLIKINQTKKDIVNGDSIDAMLNINIVDVINEISKKIVGQEKAITTLVANIYHNQKLISSLLKDGDIDLNELDSRKVAILLDGTTGTGKTAILKEISNLFGLPLVIENANSFSETGYVGPSITDILVKLLKEADGNQELAERGIVVLDEIDKIAESDLDGKSMKLGVQEELLGFMSGATYEIKASDDLLASRVRFDTSKLTFILSGAFTRIKDLKIEEKNKNQLGFVQEESEKDRTYVVDTNDYINFGLMKEFFGRIKVITTTKTYNKDDLKKILLESEISPLKGFEKSCVMYGYKGINYNDDFINKLVDEAYEMGTGARSLQSLIQGIQDTMLLDLITNKYNCLTPVELTEESLENYQKRKIRIY